MIVITCITSESKGKMRSTDCYSWKLSGVNKLKKQMSAIITVIKAIEKDSCRLLQLQTRAAKETTANDYNFKQGLLKNQLPALQLQTRTVEKPAADCYSYK